MELYLENHSSLKSLIAEERIYPFFRDHPLFLNQHDLPPTGYYRGPQRDPAFVPREILHAGHYVEPPPLNPALGHNAWKLSPEEIEADLALFHEIEDEPPFPHSASLQPPPPIGMYPFPPPPYYYDPGIPLAPAVPSLAGPYMAAPGYPPAGAMPPPHIAPYPSFYPGPPPAVHPSHPSVSSDEKTSVPPTAHQAQQSHPPAPSHFPSFGHQPLGVPREAVPASFAQPSPPVKINKSPKASKSKPVPPATKASANTKTNGHQETLSVLRGQAAHGSGMSPPNGFSSSATQPSPFSPYSAPPKSPKRAPAMSPPSTHAAPTTAPGQRPVADAAQVLPHADPELDPRRFSPPSAPPFASFPSMSASAPPAPAPYSFPPPPGPQRPSSIAPLAPARQSLFPTSLPTPGSTSGSASPSNGTTRISPSLAPPKLPSLSHPHRSPPRLSPNMPTALPPLFPPVSVPGMTKTSPLLAPLGKTDASVPVGPATGLPLPSWLKPLSPQGGGPPKLPHEARSQPGGPINGAGGKPYWV